jgi:hypothetical protein
MLKWLKTYEKIIILVSLLLFGLFAFPTISRSQAICGEHERMVDFLKKHHNEDVFIIAVTSKKGLITITRNEDTGDWSVLHTDVNKVTCFVFGGEGLMIVDKNKSKSKKGTI